MLPQGWRKRQHMVVGEDDDRAPGQLARELKPRLGGGRIGGPRRTAPVGIVEQPEPLLELEHAAHGGIDHICRNEAARERLGQTPAVGIAHHVDIDAGEERRRGRLGEIAGDAVAQKFRDRIVVADDHAVEANLPAQPVAEQRNMDSHRDAGHIVESRHDRGTARGHRRREGRQIDFMQKPFGDIRRGVFAPGEGGAISAEMLGRGGDGAGAGQPLGQAGPLKTAHLGFREFRANPRVFARPLGDPPPARVARDIEHRREGHIDAVGGCLDRRLAGAAFPQRGVERSRLGERDREDGFVPMQGIEADQKRDAEPCLFHRDFLNGMHLPRSPDVKEAADPPGANALDHAAGQDRPGDSLARRRHSELADLLLNRHRREERVDPSHASRPVLRWYRKNAPA